MHYDIDYSGLSEIEKHNKAIQDTKDYFGEEKFEKLVDTLKQSEPPGMEIFAMMMDLGGVRGYPVKAMYNHVWPL
jgi:hypothetical protein